MNKDFTKDSVEQNLQVGEEIKYINLCKRFDVPYFSGIQKINQLEQLAQYCKFTKNGTKYHIDEIYDTPVMKYKPAPPNYINFKQYLPSVQDGRERGVYIIQQDNNVYIGSTIINFRQRFYQHYKRYEYEKYPMYTNDMLMNGGTFDILWIANKDATEEEIRKKEEYYIHLYSDDPKYNLINVKMNTHMYKGCKKESIKYKKIKIRQDDLNKVEEFLQENQIQYDVMKK